MDSAGGLLCCHRSDPCTTGSHCLLLLPPHGTRASTDPLTWHEGPEEVTPQKSAYPQTIRSLVTPLVFEC